jgi:replication-associated recombination protein RarA
MALEHLDPWVDVRTRHGLPGDQVISALQKEIRRGRAENAALLAYEMVVTSPEMEAKLWQRLLTISVEDIGPGEWQAPVLVHTLWQMCRAFDRAASERRLLAVHAVRYLCGCAKDRSSDEMSAWVRRAVESGAQMPVIPDYALDMHTARGAELGRGLRHFYEEAARVLPEAPGRDDTYRQRLLAMLHEEGEAA